MIVIYHQNNRVVEVLTEGKNIDFSNKSIAENLFSIAKEYPDHLMIWCRLDLKSYLNYSNLQDIFHHDKIMASYTLSTNFFLPETIGYVDESPFLNVKKDVSYPTWQMSGDVGGISALVLNALYKEVQKDSNFDYFLNSLAKLAMLRGLLCYSEPKLLSEKKTIKEKSEKRSFLLFRFVKQHYKTRWTFLLFLNLLIYEKELAIFPFISSLFFKKRILKETTLHKIESQYKNNKIIEKTIDVIIPTIGRKECLYDVLKDLSNQTLLPQKVIIVEQNPDLNSVSELDYISDENWPFQIKHKFINQAGACNARNLALTEVEHEWVFMADDDIRISNDFLDQAFKVLEKRICEQITFACFEPNYPQNKKEKEIFQWETFGSGCSIVRTKNVKSLFYNKSFEFGFGEDSDFGMQLRNLGHDILYSPKPEILHLKSPIGGFRTKPILVWQKEVIQPKPSPTVMLYKILHLTKQQIKGYKTVLFFKYYRVQTIKNPIKYFLKFNKQWDSSIFWANQIKK
ncbi:glycosyltransferase family 2 protein [Flavobacterium johnsoniae]|jgi:glycosyltransferase involved in cell wall biosynthesis|uniref:Glycosyl transferase-like protein n=1 Tax=Flavobacterium johnsoniae (strain ATCC 17061 / DSM 2064 / JCM 8514 / BCRC 14874 / CCUG 350202 / NBRC 14942 / NCIMB 11054 / UW101) TaxID=376686 RepID=A5FN86_FLAJ1|nr:glycosyltransferase family A protein [Flavobacterium johnsoniae]ABQ03334.1 glycosyl transferase-like protein [Flavobacterium johnsoniae UW101]OXG01248.1 glycosyl transferase [Flavobacterium johnsoniae UW101]WQG79801.1 glycosyltransferase family A protein [Flavobacterium johnsoniae UW101]SHL78290.1 Glycosyltransferase, GT2 family [Flavobacterium johnsoniae]